MGCYLDAEGLTEEVLRLSYRGLAHSRLVPQLLHEPVGGVSQLHQHAAEDLLVDDGAALLAVWDDVVDILDEDDVGIHLREILDQGAVPSGAEDQPPLLVTDRPIVRTYGDGIGRGLLGAGGDVECGREGILQILLTSREQGLEGVDVLRRESKVEVDRAADRTGILGPLCEVLLDSGAWTIRILVEEDQRLRQAAIAEPLLRQQVADHRASLTGIDESTCTLAPLTQHAGLIQVVVKGKVLYPIQHLLHRLRRLASLHIGKEVAEHPRGGTTGGDKLEYPKRRITQG